MADQPAANLANTRQTMTTRLLAECRRTYGSTVDESTMESWVSSALSSLLTDQTKVTQFVYVLAMRDVRERANRYVAEAV